MAILVLGLGNPIRGDDGFGVKVMEVLSAHYRFQHDVRLLDSGILGLDLLPHLAEIERLLIIDALEVNARPGTVFRLAGEQVPRTNDSRLSAHQMGIHDLLALAGLQGSQPHELVVWGVQPECIDMGAALTATVAAAIEPVVCGVLAELRRWGVGWCESQRLKKHASLYRMP